MRSNARNPIVAILVLLGILFAGGQHLLPITTSAWARSTSDSIPADITLLRQLRCAHMATIERKPLPPLNYTAS